MSLKSIVILAMIGCLWHSTAAKNPVNMKFGKPTNEEMQMTEYAPDPNADAVMLCRLTDVNYTVQQKGFLVDYHERIRIKVLKPEGARFASVTIPYTILNQEKTEPKASKLSLNARYFSVGSISSSLPSTAISISFHSFALFTLLRPSSPCPTAIIPSHTKIA